MATMQLQLQSAAPVLLTRRSSMIQPSFIAIRSSPVGKLRVSRPFGSRVPQRWIRAEAAATEAATETLSKPVAEVVKRLQGKVYVAGISGQLASRVVKELLQAGIPVLAGVPEDDPAAEALDFALQFELIKKQEASKLQLREVDFADPDSYGIPRGATVLVALGDVQGRRKMDEKVVTQAIAAATAAGAGRIVLATPLTGGGGGGLFGLFGGAPSSSGTGELRLSRTEQQVYDSGIPFSIVRLGAPPNDSAPAAGSVELTSAGDTAKSAQLTRSQAARVVAEVLQQSGPGDNVIVEAGLSLAALDAPIPSAVAEVLPSALIEGPEEEEEEEEEAAPAPPVPAPFQRAAKQVSSAVEGAAEEAEEAALSTSSFDLKSFFGGGGRTPKPQEAAEEVEEEVEEVAKQASKPFKSFFGGGGRAKASEIEAEVEEAAEQAAKPFQSLFGGKPKQAKEEVKQDARAAKKAAYEARRQAVDAGRQAAGRAADAGRQAGRAAQKVSSGTRRVARGAEQEARKPSGGVFRSLLGLDEEGEEPEEAPKRGRWTLGGTKKVSAPKAQQQKQQARGRPAPKPKQAVPRAGRRGNNEEPPKKKGFLESLGFNQDTVYADED